MGEIEGQPTQFRGEDRDRARDQAGGKVREWGRHPDLCPDCRHGKSVESSRGSVFLLCRRSSSDPRFPKYPPQPVVSCSGFER